MFYEKYDFGGVVSQVTIYSNVRTCLFCKVRDTWVKYSTKII